MNQREREYVAGSRDSKLIKRPSLLHVRFRTMSCRTMTAWPAAEAACAGGTSPPRHS